jgi:ABC-2 type transport system permease protein
MTTARATYLLAQSQGRVLMHRMRIGLTENRLLTLTITTFLLVYALAAYFLVGRGIDFIHRLPLLGPLLTERLVYLMFFFFFVMLVISNATITGMGLFRRKDTGWQIALPIPFCSLVLWKTVEGMILASWGLIVLSAPILAALGRMFDAGFSFYLLNLPALICLVTISANISTWILLAVVRWARRWWWYPLGAVASVLLATAAQRMWFSDSVGLTPGDVAGNVNQILRHTQICTHPLLPSSWVSESILSSGRPFGERALFFNFLLLSNALFCLMVTHWLASRWFYPAWHRMMASNSSGARSNVGIFELFQGQRGPIGKLTNRLLGLDRASAALVKKDTLSFIREPAQWGQSALIFGLLFFYTSNLRRLGYDLDDPVWSVVISHLNVLVCSLSVSTLTTRFIFPQFSMEGQRLWILGISPVPLRRLLSLKLRLNGSVMALMTTGLILISSVTISLPGSRVLYFFCAMILLSYGLTALALALGTLLPNFREPNPAKIVSGFGGTLCLITSFLYIMVSMVVLLIPALVSLKPQFFGFAEAPKSLAALECLGISGIAVATLLFGAVPYIIAKKSTKDLDYLRYV